MLLEARVQFVQSIVGGIELGQSYIDNKIGNGFFLCLRSILCKDGILSHLNLLKLYSLKRSQKTGLLTPLHMLIYRLTA